MYLSMGLFMKKIIIVISLCMVLVSLCSCKEKEPTYDANEFLPLTEETRYLEIASYDGMRQFTAPMLHREGANETKLLEEIMNSFRQTPSEKVKNFSHDKIKLPIYGLKFTVKDKPSFFALFSNGHLLTQNGEVYKFDYDFASLMEMDFPKELKTSDLNNSFPGLRLVAEDNGKWIGDFMTEAVNLFDNSTSLVKKGVTLEIKDFDGKIAYGIIHNENYSLLEYSEAFNFHTFVDGEWKNVPPLHEFYFIEPLYMSAKKNFEKEFHLGVFAPLPAGKYRIIFCGLTAEFDVE